MQWTDLCRVFGITGKIDTAVPMTAGNINGTYKITTSGDNPASYIIQRINTYVFSNPAEMMSNIIRVTEHIREKLSAQYDEFETARRVLHFLKTADGKPYFLDGDGNYYRAYRFIDRSVTYNGADAPALLQKAGWAFGNFGHQLADFDASLLYETIPNFHNTANYYDRLEKDANDPGHDRVKTVKRELDFLFSHRVEATCLSDAVKQGELPLRVTHNDTKLNNVLFDCETDEPLAVIDLDTVMPGLVAYDFGDAVRCGASTAEENESDLSRVSFDLSKFRAFATGYLPPLSTYLTDRERASLADGVLAVTLELSARFLDDYITGDRYFKIAYPEHNLVRARNQIRLAEDILAKQKQIAKIIRDL